MKKVICMAVALCMVLCLLPSVVIAAEPQIYASGHLELDAFCNHQFLFTAPGDGVVTITLSNVTPGVEIGFGPSGYAEYTQYTEESVVATYEVLNGSSYDIQFWSWEAELENSAVSSFDYEITYTGEGNVSEYIPPIEGETADFPVTLTMPSGALHVPAESMYYFNYQPMGMFMQQSLTVSGAPGFEIVLSAWDYELAQVVETSFPDVEGVATVTLDMNSTWTFSFAIRNSTASSQTYSYAFGVMEPEQGGEGGEGEEPAVEGSEANPFIIESLPIDLNINLTADTCWNGVFYQYTAERDGVINSISETSVVSVTVNGDYVSFPLAVNAGDVILINPWAMSAGDHAIHIAYEESPEIPAAPDGSELAPFIIDSLPMDLQVILTEDNCWDGIFYKYTAQVGGIINAVISDGSMATISLNGEFVNFPVNVSVGDEIVINIWSMVAGTYNLSLSYSEIIDDPENGNDPGEDNNPGEDDDPDDGEDVVLPDGAPMSGTVEMNSMEAVYGGADEQCIVYLNVTVPGTISATISGTPGYAITLFYPDGTSTILSTGSSEVAYNWDVTEPGVYYVLMRCYDSAAWDYAAGSITYAISFTETAVEIEKPAYEIGDIVITEPGVFDVPMLFADVTIFTFKPAETGIYKITVGEHDLIGYYGGGAWYIYDSASVEHGVTMEWTCTEVEWTEIQTILDENGQPIETEIFHEGQSAMIGIISESDSVSVTVEKVGEYVPPIEDTMEWTEFVPDDAPVPVVPEGDNDYIPMDVVEDLSSVMVLGEDGYYHYGTTDGPIIVIDLSYSGNFPIKITEAMGYGTVGFWQYADDQLVAKYDCGNFLASLQEAGPVALTDEILHAVIQVGNSSGWWFMAAGGAYEDHAHPWLSLCSYVEITENDGTGDMIGVVVAMLAVSGMGITVLKKRGF